LERPAPEELRLLDAYWRAANYLSVGQIYLLDNPLLREPLRRPAGPERPIPQVVRGATAWFSVQMG
jgi:phosphoketolase